MKHTEGWLSVLPLGFFSTATPDIGRAHWSLRRARQGAKRKLFGGGLAWFLEA
jgi:hypothetical protein